MICRASQGLRRKFDLWAFDSVPDPDAAERSYHVWITVHTTRPAVQRLLNASRGCRAPSERGNADTAEALRVLPGARKTFFRRLIIVYEATVPA